MKLSELIVPKMCLRGTQPDTPTLNLQAATLEPEPLTAIVLEGAMAEDSEFQELHFSQCDLTTSKFFGCTFRRCRFVGCNLHKAEFHDCRFENVRISNCQLTKTEWYDVSLQGAVLVDCDARWASFQSLDLRYASLRTIVLEGSVWADTKTYGARFEDIDTGANYPVRILDTDISPNGTASPEQMIGTLWLPM